MSDKGRVLVVDDNPYSSKLLQELLAAHEYTVSITGGGEAALAELAANPPDLVVMDVRLPDLDPFVFADAIKTAHQTRDIPVIFMCAADDEDGRTRGLELGDDLILKPFDAREVLARVERQVTVSKVRSALRESEAKFRSVMESAIDAIISGDTDGNIRSWNRAAVELFGHSPEEAIGQPIELIIPHRYREQHREGMNRVSSGGPSHVIGRTVELSALHKSGAEFPIELSLATWILDDERYFTGIIRDISERKQAEQKFRSVTESAIDAIISADHHGNIVSWNSAATRILEFEESEVIGQPLEIIIPQRHHDAHQRGMKRVTEGGESRVIGKTVELHARTKSGRELPIELSLSTWTVHDERYYTGIIRDISERKEAEDQLREYAARLAQQHEELKLAQSQLVESEKAALLGRLLAGLLHELNTPLGAIRSAGDSFARILQSCNELLAADEREEAVRVKRAVELGLKLPEVVDNGVGRIESVIDGLSQFVTLDEHPTTEPRDIREMLESAITVLHPRTVDRIVVTKLIPSEPVWVECHPTRLSHAFLNILENAVDAIADEGDIEVTVDAGNDAVVITIRDSGRGMDEEQVKAAFDFTFYHRDGRVRLSLGLASSRRAVVEAGGTLTLESRPGEGTTVRMTLPVGNAPGTP